MENSRLSSENMTEVIEKVSKNILENNFIPKSF